MANTEATSCGEPLRHGADGRVRTFWHNEYFRSCYGKQGAPAAMDAQQLEAWAAYDAIIHDPSMAVTVRQGIDTKRQIRNNEPVIARSIN